jgi:UDP-2-acetamido-2-deoxy-ribo-hexuluronate aminotransferase
VHYPLPLNQQPAVSDFNAVLDVSNRLSQTVMSLPMHAYMEREIFENIVDGFKSIEQKN